MKAAIAAAPSDPDYRGEIEHKLWGLDELTDPKERPISGYMAAHADGGVSGSLSQYGGIVIKLKPSVHERSTFTFDDSFAYAAMEHDIRALPSHVSKPRYSAWNPSALNGPVFDVQNVDRPGRYA